MNEQKTNDEHHRYFLARDYVYIPMEQQKTGHLFVRGSLNGVEGFFIVDTGAGATVVEAKLQEKFGMKAEFTEEKATGAGAGNLHLQASPNNCMQLGACRMEDLSILLMDLGHVNEALSQEEIEEVDGVIGFNILLDRKAMIDYGGMGLYLQASR